MTSQAASCDLATLDAFRPAALDPAIRAANLAALAAVEPALATQLDQVTLPATWRPAVALDGTPTYRLEEPGQLPIWLGQSAAPHVRAVAWLQDLRVGDKNLALPSVGAGAELRRILAHSPPGLAVYVFEADVRVLAAVLNLHDFAADIRASRCLLVPPGRELAFLRDLLRSAPGLLPPGNIVLPHAVAPERLPVVRQICEQIFAEVTHDRARRLAALGSPLGTAAPPSREPRAAAQAAEPAQAPRLAVLALAPERGALVLAAELAEAARQLGWPVLPQVFSDPRHAHPLLHCQALAEFHPTLAVCVGHAPSVLPAPLPGVVAMWHLREAAVASPLPAEVHLHLAASPRIAAALERAGAAAERVRPFYWACRATPAVSAEAPPLNRDTPSVVALVCDLPESDASAHGIRQVSHRQLWRQLRLLAERSWQTPRAVAPTNLLVAAERECDLRIADAALRETLLDLIAQAVVPAVVAEQIAATLSASGFHVGCIGRGWGRLAGPALTPVADSILDLPRAGLDFHPVAWVFADTADPLGPAVPEAAASGRAVLLHALGGRPLKGELGDVLRPGVHFEVFADLAGLRGTLELVRGAAPQAQRRAAQAREHIGAHHSYAHRLRDLLMSLSAARRSNL